MIGVADSDNTIFDWAPHLARLKREADEAASARRADPWAEAEAECWLDLIEAEIEAHRALPQSRPEVVAGLRRLAAWKGELRLIIRRLRAVPRSGSGGNPLHAARPENEARQLGGFAA